jgi:phosphoglycerate dehydrogenase-like enzyme
MSSFRVAVDRGVRLDDGTSSYSMEPLEHAGLSWSFLDETVVELQPEQVDGWDAVIVGGASVTESSLQSSRPPLLIARLGAGYDTVAVEACTDQGILVTTAPDGVRRAMASAGITLVLALAHRLLEKERRTRAGVWDRTAIGLGLSGRTLGILGLGNIGSELCRLAAPFPLRRIGHDRFAPPVEGVESVDLTTLLRESDYLVVTLPLTSETHHLLDAERLALMKPSAYLVNIARGPVVDQAALTSALVEGRLAGAALDVFEQEPLDPGDPLIGVDNVILTGHDMGLTLDMTGDTARSACSSVIDVAQGRVPTFVLNPEVLAHPRLASLRRS